MAELNPVIRNAIFEALVILHEATTEGAARREKAEQLLGLTLTVVPDYWEEPVLGEALRQELRPE